MRPPQPSLALTILKPPTLSCFTRYYGAVGGGRGGGGGGWGLILISTLFVSTVKPEQFTNHFGWDMQYVQYSTAKQGVKKGGSKRVVQNKGFKKGTKIGDIKKLYCTVLSVRTICASSIWLSHVFNKAMCMLRQIVRTDKLYNSTYETGLFGQMEYL